MGWTEIFRTLMNYDQHRKDQLIKEKRQDEKADRVFSQCPLHLKDYYAYLRHKNREQMFKYNEASITDKPELVAKNLESIDKEQIAFDDIMDTCKPCENLRTYVNIVFNRNEEKKN